MGTYLTLKLKNRHGGNIRKANDMWKMMNPGYEDTMQFMTQKEMNAWLREIHTDDSLKHLRWLKTTKDINKAFPVWGLGCFQVKITMGDYLCSEMAGRYLRYLEACAEVGIEFAENSLENEEYARQVVEETASGIYHADECLVDCPGCHAFFSPDERKKAQ